MHADKTELNAQDHMTLNAASEAILQVDEQTPELAAHTHENIQVLGRGGFGIVVRIKQLDNHAFKLPKYTDALALEALKIRMLEGRNALPHKHLVYPIQIQLTTSLILMMPIYEPFYNSTAGFHSCITMHSLASIMEQIEEGITHFHMCGLVHFDIKRENILIDDTIIKLTDFDNCDRIQDRCQQNFDRIEYLTDSLNAYNPTLQGKAIGFKTSASHFTSVPELTFPLATASTFNRTDDHITLVDWHAYVHTILEVLSSRGKEHTSLPCHIAILIINSLANHEHTREAHITYSSPPVSVVLWCLSMTQKFLRKNTSADNQREIQCLTSIIESISQIYHSFRSICSDVDQENSLQHFLHYFTRAIFLELVSSHQRSASTKRSQASMYRAFVKIVNQNSTDMTIQLLPLLGTSSHHPCEIILQLSELTSIDTVLAESSKLDTAFREESTRPLYAEIFEQIQSHVVTYRSGEESKTDTTTHLKFSIIGCTEDEFKTTKSNTHSKSSHAITEKSMKNLENTGKTVAMCTPCTIM